MSEFRKDIEVVSALRQLDPDLVEAIVMVESYGGRADAFRHEPGFWTKYLADNPRYAGKNPRRVSSSYGLMQVMYPTAVDLGFRHEPEMLFLPGMNLDYGTKYLASLMKRFDGNTELAVRAYNGGPGGARKAITAPYWRKVQAALKKIKAVRA